MIYKAKIPFKSTNGLLYGWMTSSLMHGLIMEHIDTDFAEKIHSEQLRVFSQSVRFNDDMNYWTISVMNDEAYEKILLPVMSIGEAEIEQKNDKIIFDKADVSVTSYEKLFRAHYIASEPIHLIKMDILTPASFKVDGRYVNLPDPKLILSGLAKRFDKDCDIHETLYATLFEEIEQRVSLSAFDIHSAAFPLEKVRIPSFQGSVTLKVSGNETFCRYINMICEYASYSGIGIKTALGMGNVAYSTVSRKSKEEIS